MPIVFTDNAAGTLNTAIGTGDLSIVLDAGQGSKFPSFAGSGEFTYITLEDDAGNIEIVKCDARTTDTLTVAAGGRGAGGTSAKSYSAGAAVQLRPTAIAWTDILAEATAASANTIELQPEIKTATYTAVLADEGKCFLVDTTAGAVTINLDAAGTLGTNYVLAIKVTNATNNVTIDPNGTETIDGALTKVLDTLYDWVVIVSDGSNWHIWGENQPPPAVEQMAHSLQCPYQNLKIIWATAATLTATCDQMVVFDTNGVMTKIGSQTLTFDVSTTGAGGRDAAENGGAEASSDWYHLWMITEADGANPAIFGSIAVTALTGDIYALLPGSYVLAGYLGAWYNDATPDLREMTQIDDTVFCKNLNVLTDGALTANTDIAIADEVPATAREWIGWATIYDSTGAVAAIGTIAAEQMTSTLIGEQICHKPNTTNTQKHGNAIRVGIITAQQFTYKVNATTSRLAIELTGFVY